MSRSLLMPGQRARLSSACTQRHCAIALSRYFSITTKRLSSSPTSHDFAFAFDIDGVLLRSAKPIPKARDTLELLQKHKIPFILVTNGGGKSEEDRVNQLSKLLEVPLSVSQFMQSHTPFSALDQYKDGTILLMGGPNEGHRSRLVAEGYGFKTVVTPADLYADDPTIWPFGSPPQQKHVRQLPRPLAKDVSPSLSPESNLKLDAAFVFNDPRDWGLDLTILLDTLMSHQGYLGTISPLNGHKSLPNSGWQQDDQPPLYFSNPDLWWAAGYHNNRLGQGAFRAALDGLWSTVTGGAELEVHEYGKPHNGTFAWAERILLEQRRASLAGKEAGAPRLKNVYMVGDNPRSDIAGANNFTSKVGAKWKSILVKTGVYRSGEPDHIPKHITEDVWSAVHWALEDSNWRP